MTRVIKSLFLLLLVWSAMAWKVLAIASLTTGIGSSQKTSSATMSTSIGSSTAPAGSLVVIAVAGNNIGTTDGDLGDITGVADDAGNTYTKAAQFTNGQGSAAGGATVAIYYAVVTNDVVTAVTTITATFSTAVAARAIMVKAFSVASGNLVAVEQTNTLAGDGADPGALALSSMPSREYLVIRATAVETEVTTTTISTNYTSIRAASNFATTTGGGAATNMAISAEYRIVTATSETTNPTIASADNASVMVAFYEYTPSSLPHRINNISKR